MDDEIKDQEILEEQESEGVAEGHSDYKPVNRFDLLLPNTPVSHHH